MSGRRLPFAVLYVIAKKMKLTTWNTAGRIDIQTQLDQMLARVPDTLCLREVLKSARPRWQAALEEAGFESDFRIEADRIKGVAIASRFPMRDCPTPILPRSDAIIGARCGNVPVWSVQIPNGGSNGRTKIDCIHAISEAATNHKGQITIAGDFNAPRIEQKDGTIITWGQTVKGKIRKRTGTSHGEWDRIEREAFEGLPAMGLRNVWRELNPSLIGESPTWRNYRLDHVFSNIPATSATHVEAMSYHKMIIVDFSPSAA